MRQGDRGACAGLRLDQPLTEALWAARDQASAGERNPVARHRSVLPEPLRNIAGETDAPGPDIPQGRCRETDATGVSNPGRVMPAGGRRRPGREVVRRAAIPADKLARRAFTADAARSGGIGGGTAGRGCPWLRERQPCPRPLPENPGRGCGMADQTAERPPPPRQGSSPGWGETVKGRLQSEGPEPGPDESGRRPDLPVPLGCPIYIP